MKQPPTTLFEPPEREVVEDVFGMEPAAILEVIGTERRTQDLAAAREMRAVTAWADAHRITDPQTHGHGALDPDIEEMVDAEASTRHRRVFGWSFAGPDGIEGLLRLSGQNAYLVTEFAITQVAVRLTMSETAARAYVGQALELRERLPRLWAQVMTGALPAWKARRIAEHTIPLRDQSAAWVDAQLAAFAHKLSLGRVEACVEAAIARFEPDLADQQARNASERRGVWTEHHTDGTSQVTATTATPDALAFDDAVAEVAATLAALGDTDGLQVRRAKALGVLADPQGALDLTSTLEALDSRDPGDLSISEQLTGPRRPTRTRNDAPTIHLHVHLADAAVHGGSGARGEVGPVVRVDAPGVHGPRSLTAVDLWLRDAAPGTLIKITPVIDLTDRTAVDAYEIPQRISDQVDERDQVCQFPWCSRRGRHDKDHIISYLPPDQGGPPDQTTAENLARLCRYHHRVKTHTDWTYRRDPHNGTLHWTTPLGQHYTVDPTGTAACD